MEKNPKIEVAFVAPNSICQGEQVATLWNLLFKSGLKINFAYTSFPWSNDATNIAGVTCIIVGYSKNECPKRLYVYSPKTKKTEVYICQEISPYLTKANISTIVSREQTALSATNNLTFGNMPNDGGNLIFEYAEGQKVFVNHKEIQPFIKKFIGSSELMKSEFRYCLWLNKEKEDEWSKIPVIAERVNKCYEWRKTQTKTGAAYKFSDIPWRFGQLANPSNPESALVIPAVTSENRYYMPIDFIKHDTIVNNAAFMLPDASYYDFAILTSHMVWMKLTAGRLESRYRYSRDMTFNTFIWPKVSEEQKTEITSLAKQILRIRAVLKGQSITLGDMYNDDKMPEELKEAHNNLDLAVEKAYREKPFNDDEERLSFLLNLYSEAIANKGKK